jgi:RNA polymerase subunit RPABC4/transcription elongation factor Spt4
MTERPFGSEDRPGRERSLGSEEMLHRAREQAAGSPGGPGGSGGSGGGASGGPRFEPCPSCGRLVASWADPCPYCRERTGFQQWSSAPAVPGRDTAAPVVRSCPQCGQRVYSGLDKCPHCGAAPATVTSWSGGGGQRPHAPGPRRGNNAPLWIGLAVFVGVLVAAGIWGWRTLSSNDDYSFEGVDDPYTEAFLSGVRQGMEEAGIGDDSVECVFDYLETNGYFDVVAEMDLADPAAVAAIDTFNAEGGAVADLPPELQTFMEGMSLSMSECLSITEMEVATSGGPQSYGEDPEGLDVLWSRCQAADMAACDMLFWNSPMGSEYEEFGATCGGRDPTASQYCVYLNGNQPNLAVLQSECASGGFAACDLLYGVSPVGSSYENFALTCGGRNEPDYMGCVFKYGLFG